MDSFGGLRAGPQKGGRGFEVWTVQFGLALRLLDIIMKGKMEPQR